MTVLWFGIHFNWFCHWFKVWRHFSAKSEDSKDYTDHRELGLLSSLWNRKFKLSIIIDTYSLYPINEDSTSVCQVLVPHQRQKSAVFVCTNMLIIDIAIAIHIFFKPVVEYWSKIVNNFWAWQSRFLLHSGNFIEIENDTVFSISVLLFGLLLVLVCRHTRVLHRVCSRLISDCKTVGTLFLILTARSTGFYTGLIWFECWVIRAIIFFMKA